MNETLNVAIVGYGYAAKTFHAPLIAGVAGLELAVIVSSDPAKVRADWPEVVVLATPTELFARSDIDLQRGARREDRPERERFSDRRRREQETGRRTAGGGVHRR